MEVAQLLQQIAIWRVVGTPPKHVVRVDVSTFTGVDKPPHHLPPTPQSRTGLLSDATRTFSCLLQSLCAKLKFCLFFSDNVNGAGRSLTTGVGVTGGLTMEKCTAACFAAGFPLAGGEYAGFVSVILSNDIMSIIHSFTGNAVCIHPW